MIGVAQFRSGGQAGIPDDDFYHAAGRQVMAKLHVGDVAGARRALDTLSRH